MADENKTISQIKIGNYFYNIRDAQVRDVLNNITSNVVTIHSTYCSDWSAIWNLEKASELKNKGRDFSFSNRGSLRFYIDQDGKLWSWYVGPDNDNQLTWQGGLVANTPTIVKQCAIIIQYRFRVSMPRPGYFSSQILRRPIKSAGDLKADIGSIDNFISQNSTKKTCTKIGDFTSLLHADNYWFDRIIQQEGQINGYDYKLGLNDYYQSGTSRAKFTGICSLQLLIAQGTTTERLIPEDQLIPESAPEDDNDSDDIPS